MQYLIWIALLILLIGTYLLSQGVYVWDAALLLVASLTAFATSSMWVLRERRERIKATVRFLLPRTLGGWIRAGALAASTLVALLARTHPPDGDFTLLLVLWLVGLSGLILSLALPLRGGGLLRDPLSREERWGLLTLLVAALLARGVAVGQVPSNLGGDEGTQLVVALDTVAAPMGNPFGTGWYAVPTMSFFAYGLGMRLFGVSVVGGRMLSVLAGTLTVLTTFLFAREVSGRRTGWVAAVVIAFSAYHIHFSRLASNQIMDPLVGTLTLWLVWRALAPRKDEVAGSAPKRGGRAWWLGAGLRESQLYWGLAGAAAGLGWYVYFGARWVTGLVVLVLCWRVLADRDLLRRHRIGLLLFAVGWLVVTLPLLGWYTIHPSAFYERYQAVSVFASGWMAREMAATGRPMLPLLLQQIWRSITAFHLTPDPTFWYRPGRPLVDFITGALMLIGLLDAVVRIQWPSRILAHLWFWPTMTMAWILTENPPSSQRGLLLLVPVALFAAWGIERLWDLAGGPRLRFGGLAAVVLTLVVTINVVFYFGVYTPSEVYGNPTAQRATYLARYMRANPEPVCDAFPPRSCEGHVYFLGPPWFYWNFGALDFTMRGFPGEDVLLGEVPAEVVGPARFVVVPERADQMDLIRNLYPGGLETALRDRDDRLLMLVYDWPAIP